MTEYISSPANSEWTESLWTDEVEKGRFRLCAACGKNPTYKSDHPSSEREYDNALFLAITGGYGQFTDPQDDRGFLPGWKLVLCHECAHDACDKLPWLSALLTPAQSHSHTQPYMDTHPDHYGWDYDMANGTYYSKLAEELFTKGACTVCGHSESAHAHREGMAIWRCSEKACPSHDCWVGKELEA